MTSSVLLLAVVLQTSLALTDEAGPLNVQLRYSLTDQCALVVESVTAMHGATVPDSDALEALIAERIGPTKRVAGQHAIYWPTNSGHDTIVCSFDGSGALVAANLLRRSPDWTQRSSPRPVTVRLSTLGHQTVDL